jgi:predicted CoA-binding protein
MVRSGDHSHAIDRSTPPLRPISSFLHAPGSSFPVRRSPVPQSVTADVRLRASIANRSPVALRSGGGILLLAGSLDTPMLIESDEELSEVLAREVVAVVGCSTTPGKDAHEIPKYLHENGYTVLPVNPGAEEIFGRAAHDSLADVKKEIDIVDVFRPSEELPGIVDATLDREEKPILWTQLGIRDDDALARAEEGGLDVVVDHCMKVEHRRLV